MPSAMRGTIIKMDKSGHADVLLRAGVVLKTEQPVTDFKIGDHVLASINFSERNIKKLFTEEPPEEVPMDIIKDSPHQFEGCETDCIED